MKKIALLVCLLLFTACEPDDVCSENTQTTSRLVIEFFDIEDLDSPKTVAGLLERMSLQGQKLNYHSMAHKIKHNSNCIKIMISSMMSSKEIQIL